MEHQWNLINPKEGRERKEKEQRTDGTNRRQEKRWKIHTKNYIKINGLNIPI